MGDSELTLKLLISYCYGKSNKEPDIPMIEVIYQQLTYKLSVRDKIELAFGNKEKTLKEIKKYLPV